MKIQPSFGFPLVIDDTAARLVHVEYGDRGERGWVKLNLEQREALGFTSIAGFGRQLYRRKEPAFANQWCLSLAELEVEAKTLTGASGQLARAPPIDPRLRC